MSVGGTFTQYDIWAKDSMLIPQITFGLSTNDPAAAMFSAAMTFAAPAARLLPQ